MYYDLTLDNFRYLIQSLGYVTKDQVHRFFRDVEDVQNIQFYLDRLSTSKFIEVVDKNRVIYKARKTRPLQPAVMNARLRAFWVVASQKSSDVIDVFTMAYPTQLGFITANNLSYDITICDTPVHAQIACRKWKEWLPEGVQDHTHHIALVRNREAGKGLDMYGFSSYCVLDAENKPSFYLYN